MRTVYAQYLEVLRIGPRSLLLLYYSTMYVLPQFPPFDPVRRRYLLQFRNVYSTYATLPRPGITSSNQAGLSTYRCTSSPLLVRPALNRNMLLLVFLPARADEVKRTRRGGQPDDWNVRLFVPFKKRSRRLFWRSLDSFPSLPCQHWSFWTLAPFLAHAHAFPSS